MFNQILFSGVLDIKRGPVSLFGFVKNIWTDDLRFARMPIDVEMTFVKIRPRSGMSMDDLIEGQCVFLDRIVNPAPCFY